VTVKKGATLLSGLKRYATRRIMLGTVGDSAQHPRQKQGYITIIMIYIAFCLSFVFPW